VLDWNTIIIAFISSGGITAIIFKLLDYLGKKKAERDLLVAIGGDALIRIMRERLKEGCTDVATHRFCEKIYKAYKSLGGNDLVDTLWQQYQKLKIID